MQKNNIRLETIGATHTLPEISQKELRIAIEETKNNTEGVSIIANKAPIV